MRGDGRFGKYCKQIMAAEKLESVIILAFNEDGSIAFEIRGSEDHIEYMPELLESVAKVMRQETKEESH